MRFKLYDRDSSDFMLISKSSTLNRFDFERLKKKYSFGRVTFYGAKILYFAISSGGVASILINSEKIKQGIIVVFIVLLFVLLCMTVFAHIFFRMLIALGLVMLRSDK